MSPSACRALKRVALPASLIAVLAVAAPAGASSGVSFYPEQDLGEDGIAEAIVEVIGEEEEADSIRVTVVDGKVNVTDESGVATSDKECTTQSATSVTCPMPFFVAIQTWAGDDTVLVDPSLPAYVDGDAGADTITVGFGRVFGGDGGDVLTMNGGPGGMKKFGGQNGDNWHDYQQMADGFSGMEGGAGDDRLTSGAGNEVLTGGEGADALAGGGGKDRLTGNEGADALDGGDGDDRLDGDAHAAPYASDTLDGGPGRDTLDWSTRAEAVQLDLAENASPDGAVGENEGVTGFEVVRTGKGDDSLIGTDAAERFQPGRGRDTVAGGGGVDTISYANYGRRVTVDLSDPGPDGPASEPDTLAGIENVLGSRAPDVLIGDGGRNVLTANDADNSGGDRLEGRGGDDILNANGEGDSVLVGGAGDDVLTSGSGWNDRLMGGAGDDVLMATRRDGSGAVGFEGTLKGGPGNDTLDAGPGDGDRVFGGSGNDTVAGGWGDDTVVGGPGRDVMLGGTGRDLLRAVDGARDRLDCGGGGKDTAKIDGRDKVRSCETVGS